MLAKSNDEKLKRFLKEKYIFFYQVWQEMLDYRTQDMYRYNILNTCVACIELEDVIEKTMSGLFTSKQNVDDAKAETIHIIENDDILEKHNRHLKNLLMGVLGTRIEGKARGDIRDDKTGAQYISLNRLKYQLKTPIKILKTHYINYILEELKSNIDMQNKEMIYKCTNILISQCIADGWSSRGLFNLCECFNVNHTTDDEWNYFKTKLANRNGNTFYIYYHVKIETKSELSAQNVRDTINNLDIEVKLGADIIRENQNTNFLHSKIDPTKTYIVKDIIATDLYAAGLNVINYLNNKLSISTFYNIIQPNIVNTSQIIVYDVNKNVAETLKLTDIFKTYDYIDCKNSVFEDTNGIFNDNEKQDIQNKISSAFAYTNLSRISIFQETKYISLWIALESLMRTGQYEDIISHIKKVLPKIMCIRYLYRIVRNFSEDCIRCNLKKNENLDIDMTTENKKELVKKLINVFRNENKYQYLLNFCNKNSLLTYRCNEIHNLLNDKTLIKNKFNDYVQKIEWHIQRLYRIRNEITHSAFKDNKSLVIYIEHLYTYLAQVISELVFYIQNKGTSSVEETFAILVETYNVYYNILTKDNGTMQIKDILPYGVIEII